MMIMKKKKKEVLVPIMELIILGNKIKIMKMKRMYLKTGNDDD